MFSLSFLFLIYVSRISHFGFKSGIWLLIAPVPVHCFLLPISKYVQNYKHYLVIPFDEMITMAHNISINRLLGTNYR